MPPTLDRVRPENVTFFAVRQTFCLVTCGLHASLFGLSKSPSFWLLILLLCFLPSIMLFTPRLRNNAKRNLLIDTSVQSFFIGVWGFNPFLFAIYAACINITNMISGGIRFGLYGIGLLILFACIGGATQDFYFRQELPLTPMVIASTGVLIFISSLGLKMHNINLRLRKTRHRLEQQTEELTRLNNLATVINSNLNVDVIMNSVMKLIEEVYPFEAMYILTFQDQQKSLDVTGIYGSSLNESQHSLFNDLRFEVERDKSSMFIQGLLKKKVIYLPDLTDLDLCDGAPKDQELFSIKPSKSIAYFPIFINDKVIGGACFINYKTPFKLSKADIGKIQEYLIQVGTAVRNTAQFEELIKAKEIAVKAQSKAEASEETKSRFLANMSHEIRTPLTAIMGYSEAIQEDHISKDEQQKFVTHILRSSHHLLSMINDILDISKIEAHKVTLERMACNIPETLLEIESYIKIQAKEKKLDFHSDIQYPIPHTIISDPTRLKQILLNLCNNAIKFTEEGSITLSANCNDSNFLEISLIDTGIGIPEQAQEKIFNAFDQADNSTTRLFGGTGLGLCISKNLAQLLGGDIVVSSREEYGSTFKFSIPIVAMKDQKTLYIENHDQHKSILDKARESKSLLPAPLLSGCILVAEDNIENQNLIVRLIQQTGMSVDVVDNGEQAIEAAQKNKYSAILLDMQMPIMGGEEAARTIKTFDTTTPIIAFTANVMKHQLKEYQTLGFDDILEKPIARTTLYKTLELIVKKSISSATPKVLLVDDNEVNQMILQRYIHKAHENALITLSQNGLEALNAVKADNYDLILMDMEMPIMNGIDATRKMREHGCKAPIYIVTGNVDEESVLLCEEAGANGHISKPLEKEKITKIINPYLYNSPTHTTFLAQQS